ncbi:TetR/AcrR family transcriptional regulator [Frigoribacterium sp. 2-23]|uniref:TetR/AcrR family transcriptional regulator n=1 Tax=Frigoribacterium sp. 2-23 TaxID=3415006 RepID=UPI003C6FE41A
MQERPVATDRRAALKARHRQAILDAADALIAERRDTRFSVDELAERADVSRRTVFNHFASLDDIVMSVCTQVLTGAVEEFRVAAAATPVGDGTRASLFAEVTLAMRGIDLPAVISYLCGVLGVDASTGRSHQAVQEVFTRATAQLADELEQRSATLDRLEIDLLVSSMMNGIAVIAQHWIAETGAALDDASREVWARLLDRMITSIRAGYAPVSHP